MLADRGRDDGEFMEPSAEVIAAAGVVMQQAVGLGCEAFALFLFAERIREGDSVKAALESVYADVSAAYGG